MIGIRDNDICFSTEPGWGGGKNPFNTDGQERDTLPAKLARTAFEFDVVKKPSYDETGRVIPNHYHVRRSDTDELIPSNPLGAQYTPIQHRDVFDYIVNKIMPEVPEMKLELAGTIHGGGTGLIAAKFGDTFAIPSDKSASETRLFFINSNNGWGCATMGFTTVRIKCHNTLVAATKQAKHDGWNIKHTSGAPLRVSAVAEQIRKQAVAALEMKERATRLAGIPVSVADVEKCLEAIYPIHNLPEGPGRTRMLNIRNEILSEFESGDTAQSISGDNGWKLFNSFTYRVFNPAKIKKSTDATQIQFKGMAGSTAEKVRSMFNTIEDVLLTA